MYLLILPNFKPEVKSASWTFATSIFRQHYSNNETLAGEAGRGKMS